MPNPNTDDVIMNNIKYILLPGTQINNLGNPVVIENLLELSEGRFPAVHIETGKQQYTPVGANVYDGLVSFIVTYYDRWDQATVGIDVIRMNIKADLQIILNNLLENSSLAIGGEPSVTSIAKVQLAPYKGELDNATVQGMTLLKRALTLTVNVLPFDA